MAPGGAPGDALRMLVNRAGLPPERLADLAGADAHAMLDDVVRWTAANGAAIVDVVVQDEFTHDVVVACRGPIHLVYSTT